MIVLSDKKVDHLREMTNTYYELTDENDRTDLALQIVGILDYILSTDDCSIAPFTYTNNTFGTTTIPC